MPPRTRVLLAPIDMVVTEEPFAHEKLCPVLAVLRAESPDRGIEAARAVVRLGGAGHSAAIHSTDERVIMRYAARVPVLRVAVNARQQHRQFGPEHQPRAVDDARDRLCRAELDRGKPGTPAPSQLDAGRL